MFFSYTRDMHVSLSEGLACHRFAVLAETECLISIRCCYLIHQLVVQSSGTDSILDSIDGHLPIEYLW